MPGSKRKLRPGGWELRVSLGMALRPGKCRPISNTFHGPARGTDDALRDLVDKYSDAQEDGAGATVGQLLDRWHNECERMDLSPTTLRTCRAQIRQTVGPRPGKVVLSRLTPRHLDDLYGDMKDAGLGEDDPQPPRHHLGGTPPSSPLGMGPDEHRRAG
ncbi:MAG TPA: hypothetical protein VNG12_22755 [Acidimicrobiales bacterium]|nr:hypothetical protein [Acidimicrobiales bacterium]